VPMRPAAAKPVRLFPTSIRARATSPRLRRRARLELAVRLNSGDSMEADLEPRLGVSTRMPDPRSAQVPLRCGVRVCSGSEPEAGMGDCGSG